MISAANLGQECLLINQDKNQNKINVSCRLVSIDLTNSPDVSDDVTTDNTKLQSSYRIPSFPEEKRKQWINAIKRKEPWTPMQSFTCV
jgi:hypothetical protein